MGESSFDRRRYVQYHHLGINDWKSQENLQDFFLFSGDKSTCKLIISCIV